jgi:hypothetical protein
LKNLENHRRIHKKCRLKCLDLRKNTYLVTLSLKNGATNMANKNDPTLAKKNKDDNLKTGYNMYMYSTDSTCCVCTSVPQIEGWMVCGKVNRTLALGIVSYT